MDSNKAVSSQSNQSIPESSPLPGDRFFRKDAHLCDLHKSQDKRQLFAIEFAQALDYDAVSFKDVKVGAAGQGNEILLLNATGITEKDCRDLLESTALRDAALSGFKEFHCIDGNTDFRQIHPLAKPSSKP